jgi:hypothetical protein
MVAMRAGPRVALRVLFVLVAFIGGAWALRTGMHRGAAAMLSLTFPIT